MEESVSQQSDIFDIFRHAKRVKLHSIDLAKERCTHFEDFSNEVIFEIFNFFQHHRVYEAFFKLNTRFNNLLMKSTLPIRINLSSMSKLTLQQYEREMIKPNRYRIDFLQASNLFMYDQMCSFFDELSAFSRLKTLSLNGVEADYLEKVLTQLASLSYLSSLIIIGIELVTSAVYLQLFRLPALKYCSVSSRQIMLNEVLPVATDEFSPIEHLIINTMTEEDALDQFLSYVPRLRRLSFGSIYRLRRPRTTSSIPILNHLIDVSLNFVGVEFDRVFSIIADHGRTVEVLSVSISLDNDSGYMDANRWQQLIESHVPNLHIFDIQFDFPDTDHLAFEAKVRQFTALFWIERQWVFSYYYHCRTRYGYDRTSFSTDPYR